MNNNKSQDAYKTIGEIARELGLVDQKTGLIQTHTIRYWETQFKQIKPTIKAGKRRYYSPKDFETIVPKVAGSMSINCLTVTFLIQQMKSAFRS